MRINSDEVALTVVFNRARRRGRGPVDIRFVVETEQDERIQLGLKGYVMNNLWAQPLSFGRRKRGTEKTVKTHIVHPGNDEFEITKIVSASSLVTVLATSREGNQQSSCHVLKARIAPRADTPLGAYETKVTVHSNLADKPVIEIPVTVTVESEIAVSPDQFFFGIVKQGEGASRSVVVSTTLDRPLKILAIENPKSWISVRTEQGAAGKEFKVVATISDDAPTGWHEEPITIRTNNRDLPEIVVPLYVHCAAVPK